MTVSEDGTTVNVVNSYKEGVDVVDPTGAEPVGTYTISADEDWTLSVSDLPATDSNGNTYYYYVKEVSDSGYSVYSYTNNEGVNYGTITITNQKAEEYALPSTGGIGTDKYTLTGLLLCGGAGFLFFRRRRRLWKSR
ncbi:MAG: Cna B-type domain-containing protein [Clostridiales bacterium]|nr:Cna B-type domain-containing protein [Clostridiales bacterium]